MAKNSITSKNQEQAIAMAKATQRPGQTKEQSKLIAKGIEKGIEAYKKQHKARLREQDKLRKKASKQQESLANNTPAAVEKVKDTASKTTQLPWVLLVISWIGFGLYIGLV